MMVKKATRVDSTVFSWFEITLAILGALVNLYNIEALYLDKAPSFTLEASSLVDMPGSIFNSFTASGAHRLIQEISSRPCLAGPRGLPTSLHAQPLPQ